MPDKITLDTLGELTYLMRNGSVTDCLSQTWCYLQKYNNPATKQRFGHTITFMHVSRLLQFKFFSLMYNNEGPLLRSSRNSETEECEESQCDLVTSAHTAYKVFSMARDMANMFTENNIV